MMEAIVLQYWKDETGTLARVFEKVKKRQFKKLKPVKILYSFRSTPKFDEDGRPIAAQAAKLSTRERDIYGFDFEICVNEETWKSYSEDRRKQLAWHELNHCRVEYELDENEQETDKPVKDKASRVSIWIEEHDIILRCFMEELKRFPPWPSDAYIIYELYKYCRANKKKIKKARKKHIEYLNAVAEKESEEDNDDDN